MNSRLMIQSHDLLRHICQILQNRQIRETRQIGTIRQIPRIRQIGKKGQIQYKLMLREDPEDAGTFFSFNNHLY